MPASAVVTKLADFDTIAVKMMLLWNNKVVGAFPGTIVREPGMDPSYAILDCTINGSLTAELDAVAVAPSSADDKFWMKMQIGDRAAVIAKSSAGKEVFILVGSIVRAAHNVRTSTGTVTIFDDRWLLAGVPIRGKFLYSPVNEAKVTALRAARDAKATYYSQAQGFTKTERNKFKSGGGSAFALDSAIAFEKNAKASLDKANSDLKDGEKSYRSCYFRAREYPVFNEDGLPNCYDHPTYGPIFAPWPNWNIGMTQFQPLDTIISAAREQPWLSTQQPQRRVTATYWTLLDAAKYLFNTCYSTGGLVQMADAHYKTLDASLISWPGNLFGGISSDQLNIGSDQQAAFDAKENNRQISLNNRLPTMSLRGLNLCQALSHLARQAGAFDIFCDPSSSAQYDKAVAAEVGAEVPLTTEGQKATADVIKTFANQFQTTTIPKSELALVRSGFVPDAVDNSASLGLTLNANVGDQVTGPAIADDGVIERDGANVFTSVLVQSAPICMELQLHFSPTKGGVFQSMAPGGYTYALTSGGTLVNDYGAETQIIAGWSRQYRRIGLRPGGAPVDLTQTQAGGDNEEYAALQYLKNGMSLALNKTVVGFLQMCNKFPRFLSAYYIRPDYDWTVGTKYAGLGTSGLPLPPLPFLLSQLAEWGQNANKRRLAYRVNVEFWQDGTQTWVPAPPLDEVEVDAQGMFYLPTMRMASLGNDYPNYGTWSGVAYMPDFIIPRPFRINLAFQTDLCMLEAMSLACQPAAKVQAGLAQPAVSGAPTSPDFSGHR